MFPHLEDLCVDRVFVAGRSVRIQASTYVRQVPCSDCGVTSGRVHSRYQRSICDTAVAGRETLIHLRVRRFFCINTGCGKKTFAEQVPGLTVRHGRRSPGLGEVLQAVALALGGRAGARLAGRLAAAVSPMTLLRLIRALPDPGPGSPRVLGVDEFALRRGHSYATVLVDVETRRPIDILPDRSADSFATWLAAHPGIQVICRDRAGCYSQGATRGAPDAIQVADRWHLWHNLGQAVERTVAKHRSCLHAAIHSSTSPAGEPGEPSPPMPPGQEPTLRTDRWAVRARQRHTAVHDLLTQGHSLKAIARELQLARGTIRRFARAQSAEELLVNNGTGRRPSQLAPYTTYLQQRWNAGCTDATQLWREIQALGYKGGYPCVRDHLRPWRSATSSPEPTPAPPRPRQVTAWIMTNPDNLNADDNSQLKAIFQHCPHLHATRAHVQAFAHMMTQRHGDRLEQWMTAVDADDLPALHSFVLGLRRDLDAVTAGLTLPWSSGPVEGHVNRIKTLKRQGYGRANHDLLRKRILLAD
ncbi:ISL3 family transposase [Sphaerisporangium sp. NBC_01403]|uniref:ISL3 family transposase n=1 Tax=Sphaerisporangium sp. NBC_01403 TaxID=2903599 RepID=UPI00324EA863